MKYSLSFCDVYQIADDIYETIDKEGATIDQKCAEESWNFWNDLRKEPFALLVNCKNSFSFSFEGAQQIGKHPLQNKTAFLIHDASQRMEIESAMEIKKTVGHPYYYKVFSERDEALKWLGFSMEQPVDNKT